MSLEQEPSAYDVQRLPRLFLGPSILTTSLSLKTLIDGVLAYHCHSGGAGEASLLYPVIQ